MLSVYICQLCTLKPVYNYCIIETVKKVLLMSGPGERGVCMAIRYKLDILEALKSKGFSTYKLRKDKLLSEGVIQSLRSQKMISLENVGQLCALLDCQPGDLLEYVKE